MDLSLKIMYFLISLLVGVRPPLGDEAGLWLKNAY